jgi:uncharacterized protein
MTNQNFNGLSLRASREVVSGKCVFPAISESSPSANRYTTIDLSPAGELYTFTTLHSRPSSGIAPVTVGYIDFPEGARVFGRLVLPEGQRPQIGMMLRPNARELEVDDLTFVPDDEEQA